MITNNIIYPFENKTKIYTKNNIKYIYSKYSIISGCIIKINKGMYNNSQSGLAHLFEHTIFEETIENKLFFDKIKQYNGIYNGATSSYITSYYFQIKNNTKDEFDETFKLFIDLFDVPALNYPDKIKGTINIVNNEIDLYRLDILLLIYSLIYLNDLEYTQTLIPYNNFDDTTINKLKEFKKEYYSNNFELLVFHNIDENYEIQINDKLKKLLIKDLDYITNIPKNKINNLSNNQHNYPIKLYIPSYNYQEPKPIIQTNIIKYTNYFNTDFIKIVYNLEYSQELVDILQYVIYLFNIYFNEYLNILFDITYNIEQSIEIVFTFYTKEIDEIINIYQMILNILSSFNKTSYEFHKLSCILHAQYMNSLLSDKSKYSSDFKYINYCFKYNQKFIYEIPPYNQEQYYNKLINLLQITNSQILFNQHNDISNYKNIFLNMKYNIKPLTYKIINKFTILKINIENNTLNSSNKNNNSLIKPLLIQNTSKIDIHKKYNINEFAFKINFNNVKYDYTLFLLFLNKITLYFNNKLYGYIKYIDYDYNKLIITIKDFEDEQENNIKKIFNYLFNYEYSIDELKEYHNFNIDKVKNIFKNIISNVSYIIDTEFYRYSFINVINEKITTNMKFKKKTDINKIKYSNNTPIKIKLYLENIKKYPLHNNYILYDNIHFPINKTYYTFDKNTILIKQIAQRLLYQENNIYHLLYRYMIASYLNKIFFDIFRTQKQYSYTASIINKIYEDSDIIYYLMNFVIIIDYETLNIESIASEINNFIYFLAPRILLDISQEQVNIYLKTFKELYLENTQESQLINKSIDINILKNINHIRKSNLMKYYMKYVLNKYNVNINTMIFKHYKHKFDKHNLNTTFIMNK